MDETSREIVVITSHAKIMAGNIVWVNNPVKRNQYLYFIKIDFVPVPMVPADDPSNEHA